ncbi:hypothetical protein RSK60_190028 [Ralstonia solanacearum K60]|nr:hypothetical protein RSK60_190028 [Ralstonia solanacearum K60]
MADGVGGRASGCRAGAVVPLIGRPRCTWGPVRYRSVAWLRSSNRAWPDLPEARRHEIASDVSTAQKRAEQY